MDRKDLESRHGLHQVLPGLPGGGDMFSYGVNGPMAVARAVYDLLANNDLVANFAVCDHPIDGGKVHKIVTFGVSREDPICFRYIGSNNNPDGAGSHSVVATWYPSECMDAAYIAAALVSDMHGGMIVRLKDTRRNERLQPRWVE